MSDEPIPAEVVRADQIRVGDRIIDTAIRVVTERYKSGTLVGWIVFHFDDGDPGVELKPEHPVARILPEPVARPIEPADPARILVTACKLIAEDETIAAPREQLAGYLLQLTRCGGAKPYEVKERTNEQ